MDKCPKAIPPIPIAERLVFLQDLFDLTRLKETAVCLRSEVGQPPGNEFMTELRLYELEVRHLFIQRGMAR